MKTIFLLLSLVPLLSFGSVYYVSPSGVNTNPGTLASPFKSLTYAGNKLKAGDILNVRAGTYNEYLSISASGTSSAPIIIQAYQNEIPVVDGLGISVGAGSGLVRTFAPYTQIIGLIVCNSDQYGITLEGANCFVKNCTVYNCQQTGIGGYANNCIIEGCTVYNTSLANKGGVMSVGWASGITCARRQITGCIMRKNIVHDVWGEGISTFEALNTTIEDNVVWDYYSVGIYASDTQNATIQRNFIYLTKSMANGSQVGIGSWNETENPVNKNNTFINNIVYGCRKNFYHIGDMTGLQVANNTFINSIYQRCTEVSGIVTGYFRNNLVIQDDALPCIYTEAKSGFTFSNNLYNKSYPSNAKGTGDVIANPLFVGGDALKATSYKLQNNSPAINAGINVGNLIDYFGNIRTGIPDIGASEYLAVMGLDDSKETKLDYILSDKQLKVFLPFVKGKLSIFDILGRELISKNINDDIVDINLSSFMSGLYILKYDVYAVKFVLR